MRIATLAGERLNLTALTTDELRAVYLRALEGLDYAAQRAIHAEADDRLMDLEPEDTDTLPN